MNNTRKPKRIEGSILAVPLGADEFGFARVLSDPLVGFYDLFSRCGCNIKVDEVIGSKYVFKVWVSKYAFQKNRWPSLGIMELSQEDRQQVSFFREDPITGRLYLYDTNTSDKTPLTFEQCQEMERAAVWDPEHVEERLRAKLHGVESVFGRASHPRPPRNR